MAVDVHGIGFRTADQVAASLGIAPDSVHRLRAGLLFALGQGVEEGHCFLPREELLERSAALLEVALPLLEAELPTLEAQGSVVVETRGGLQTIWLAELHQDETEVVEHLQRLRVASARRVLRSVDGAVAWAQEQCELQLSPGQRAALGQLFSQKLVVLTGGPGTGKTTLIRAVVSVWLAKGLKVALAAPTVGH